MTARAPRAHRSVSAVLAVAWLAVLAGTIVALARLGSGPLATPPLRHPQALPAWLHRCGAPTALFAVVRLLALVLAWYLLATTTIGVLARASRVPRLVATADRFTVPPIRRLLTAAAGAGMSLSLSGIALVPMAVAAPHRGNRPTASRSGPATGAASRRPPSVVVERLPDQSGVVLERLPDDDDTATMSVEAPTTAPAPATTATWWTVRPGESFWSEAERVARSRSGAATDVDISDYWTTLIEHNRDRLVDPANPDLIYPGQRFELPPPA